MKTKEKKMNEALKKCEKKIEQIWKEYLKECKEIDKGDEKNVR